MAGVSWWIVLFFKDVRSCLCRVCLYTWQSCLRLALPARIQDPGIIYPDLLRSANISISSLCRTLTDALFKPLWLLLQISVVELNNGVCKEKKREEEWREWKKPGEKLWGHERLCENCCLSQSACTQSCLCQRKKLPTQIMAGMWNRMAGQGNGGRGCVNWKLGSLCGHYKETWDVLTQRS